jgi:hypothetical protein
MDTELPSEPRALMPTRSTVAQITFSFVVSYIAAAVAAGMLFSLFLNIYTLIVHGGPVAPFPASLVVIGGVASAMVGSYALVPSVVLLVVLHAIRTTGPVAHALGATFVAVVVAAWLHEYDGGRLANINMTWPMIPLGAIGGVVFWRVWNVSQAGWSKP